MGNSTGSRLTAVSIFKKPFGKRKASNVSTPVSSKKLKQTSISEFLTPRTQNIPITPPATVHKPLQKPNSLFQNPLVSITHAQDITHLPGGLIPSKQVIGDGNCLPRSILLAMTGSQESHADLRKRAIDFIRDNAACFLSDIQLLGYSTVEAYCSKMSKNAEFGDVVMLMACCITENVSIQLFTWNSHASDTKSVQTLSSQTFKPVKGFATPRFIQVHLDTGDSKQNRQGSIVIGRKQTRAPHYDTSNGREFAKELERIESSEDSDPEADVADTSFVSNASTLIQESPGQKTVPKKCSRCRYVEGTRKSGVLVLFDTNPKTDRKYSECRGCKLYTNEIKNPKNNHKVRILFKPKISNNIPHQLQQVSPTCCSWWGYRGELLT